MAEKKVQDAIVVGSGAAGGMAAKQLCEKGLKVLLLEAGRTINPSKDFIHHKWPYDFKYRGKLSPSKAPFLPYTADAWTEHLYANLSDHPYTTEPGKPFVWVRLRAVGGKTLIWGRVSLRMSDLDFKAKSHDGYGDDWPISYKAIAPYYDLVESMVGISGNADHISHLPDGKFLPPVPMNCGEHILKKGCEKLGRRLINNRCAVITRDYNGRQACHWCGYCGRGCDSNSMFNSLAVTLPMAMKTGNLTLRPNSVVRQVLVDPHTGKAGGIGFFDANTKQYVEAHSKLVVLGASTLESTRIMLNSISTQYPNGIANSSGVLGHYFIEHIMGSGAVGLAPTLKGKRIENEDGRPIGTYIPRFRNVNTREKQFLRGYAFQCNSGAGLFPGTAKEVPGFGADLKSAIRNNYPALVSMGGFGEVLARYDNHVSIDKNRLDPWGIPVLKMHVAYGENERAMSRDIADTAEEIMRAAGIEILVRNRALRTPGWSIHELGTARMGNDPKTSVLNTFCQAHDVKNLFVVDGSCFVSASNQNPTLTIMALCARACDYIAEEYKAGRL
ncbi:MAG: GMC family oxidoreductase [Acidobacteria bacterium]|nr:GMC family oxidoreductase [Acidobacteriota bacterium]MBI3657542.1 GMC family oxidoreductase [Acidobacteriota bacterium]